MNAHTPVARRLILILVVLAAAGVASAHVMLDYPNGGEMIEVGTIAEIEWHVVIQHGTIGWDLWYSINGPGGPWIEIVTGLPPGDIFAGAIHVYDWTVPNSESDQVRVRVRQDNGGNNYEDISDSDLVITVVLFKDGFESGDTGGWSSVVQ